MIGSVRNTAVREREEGTEVDSTGRTAGKAGGEHEEDDGFKNLQSAKIPVSDQMEIWAAIIVTINGL